MTICAHNFSAILADNPIFLFNSANSSWASVLTSSFVRTYIIARSGILNSLHSHAILDKSSSIL